MNKDKLIEKERYETRAQSQMAGVVMATKVCLGSETMPDYLKSPYVFYERKISESIRPNHRVLELGAGIGLHTLPLLQTGALVIASDISPSSLSLLKQRFKNTPANLQTVVADMESLPFEDSYFDVIVSAGALSYGEPTLVDAEIRRVLRPAGTLICVDSLNHNLIYRANRWLHYLRGNRTKSTLKRMPDLTRIAAISANFQKSGVCYFGALTFAMPLMTRLLGASTAQKLSDDFDDWCDLKTMAFKFVFVGSGIGFSDSAENKAIDESIHHYARFPHLQKNSKDVIDKQVLKIAISENLPLNYRVVLQRPKFFLDKSLKINARGRNYLRFLIVNNFLGGQVFMILVYDSVDNLIHRSTIVMRDFRRKYLIDGYEITQVYTLQDQRGQGIATAVVRALMQAAPSVQFHWCVRQKNSSSIQVATKAGLIYIESIITKRYFNITFY